MFKKILVLFIVFTFASCNITKAPIGFNKKKSNRYAQSSKASTYNRGKKTANEVIESTSRTVVSNDVVGNYIMQYKDIAMGNMKTYGIPASIILAQGILESGAGRGELAVYAKNHFGIKCHNDWQGEIVRHDDDEKQECFRKYDEVSESYRDHALFLVGRSRYSSLFILEKNDYESWANGLRKAGYATDPKYPQKLISCIERYNLDQYDAQVLGNNYNAKNNFESRIASIGTENGNFYEVQKGDTLYSISRKYNLMVDELKRMNKLSDNTLSIGQKLKVN